MFPNLILFTGLRVIRTWQRDPVSIGNVNPAALLLNNIEGDGVEVIGKVWGARHRLHFTGGPGESIVSILTGIMMG